MTLQDTLEPAYSRFKKIERAYMSQHLPVPSEVMAGFSRLVRIHCAALDALYGDALVDCLNAISSGRFRVEVN